jgi:predicted enzyme involved in methoxymalonyl-ACP biosynthesis
MVSRQKPEDGVIAIAATFTAEPLSPPLRFVLDQAGLALDVKFAPYHQVFQELLSPTSLSAVNTGGVDVVLVRLEDFVRGVEGLDEAISTVRRTGAELAEALVHHAQHMKSPTLLAVMPPSPDLAEMLLPEIEAANEVLLAEALTLPGITLLSAADLEPVSAGEHYDSVTDELAHLPFTEEQYASIALAIARKVHALLVPAHKVLVLDCDETLWRGVVGEDGVAGCTSHQLGTETAQRRFACPRSESWARRICFHRRQSCRMCVDASGITPGSDAAASSRRRDRVFSVSSLDL